MKKSMLAAMIMTSMAVGGFSSPAFAQEAVMSFDEIFRMSDKNKDSMVTKAEFLDAMGRAYDMKMAKMKASPNADKMLKGDAMTKEGLRSLINDIHHGA